MICDKCEPAGTEPGPEWEKRHCTFHGTCWHRPLLLTKILNNVTGQFEPCTDSDGNPIVVPIMESK